MGPAAVGILWMVVDPGTYSDPDIYTIPEQNATPGSLGSRIEVDNTSLQDSIAEFLGVDGIKLPSGERLLEKQDLVAISSLCGQMADWLRTAPAHDLKAAAETVWPTSEKPNYDNAEMLIGQWAITGTLHRHIVRTLEEADRLILAGEPTPDHPETATSHM